MKVQKREERRLALDLLSKSLGWKHGNMCRKDLKQMLNNYLQMLASLFIKKEF